MTTITGKNVLLTGASRGIGALLACELAKKGATIVGVSRSQEGLDRVAREVKELGGKWIGIPFDISRIEALPTLIEQCDRVSGSIDILINNAGIEIYKNFPDYSLAEIQSILNANLWAAMELSRLVLPSMLRRKCGHIVNMASLAGKKGASYNSVYSASKAGLIMWSDGMRLELFGTGVEISAICPGYISELGMTADTGVAIPKLSGISTPAKTVKDTIAAIENNRVEVIINQDAVTETLTKILFAIAQIFPKFGDATSRWMGITKLNRMRVEKTKEAKTAIEKRKQPI
jgi:short-subunit dehydrogenase